MAPVIWQFILAGISLAQIIAVAFYSGSMDTLVKNLREIVGDHSPRIRKLELDFAEHVGKHRRESDL